MKFGDRCHTIWTIRLGWKFFEKPVGGGLHTTSARQKKKHTIWTLGSLNWDPFLGGIKLDANVYGIVILRDFPFFVHEVWVGNSSADPCLVRDLPFQSSMG